MNNYGFMTFDDNGKKIEGAVNSKWPIFGPNYSDIKRAFRTIHLTDTKQYDYKTSPSVVLPSIPSGNGEKYATSEFHGYEKVLVATIPHGYKKRPLGYVSISGVFVKNTRGKWAYNRYYDRHNDFPPSATLYGVGVTRGTMQSCMGSEIRGAFSQGAFTIFSSNPFNASSISYPTSQYWGFTWLGSNYGNDFSVPGNNSATPDVFGAEYRPPYVIEIDDENVYVYRYYYWCDVYKRYFYRNDYGYDQADLRARMQGIIDYAGSDFDVTIYLCPYSMEDLI